MLLCFLSLRRMINLKNYDEKLKRINNTEKNYQVKNIGRTHFQSFRVLLIMLLALLNLRDRLILKITILNTEQVHPTGSVSSMDKQVKKPCKR